MGEPCLVRCRNGRCLFLPPDQALAHAATDAHIMILPTGLLPPRRRHRGPLSFICWRWCAGPAGRHFRPADRPGSLPVMAEASGLFGSPCCFLVCLSLVGVAGSRDPPVEPICRCVWTVFWFGLPWHRASSGISGGDQPALRALCVCSSPSRNAKPRSLPCRSGSATGRRSRSFAALPGSNSSIPPRRSRRLARLLAAYLAVQHRCRVIFGYEEWTRRGVA